MELELYKPLIGKAVFQRYNSHEGTAIRVVEIDYTVIDQQWVNTGCVLLVADENGTMFIKLAEQVKLRLQKT